MISGDVTTIEDYWADVIAMWLYYYHFLYSLADVIAKDVADVIATVVVLSILLLKALLCQWLMLLPLCVLFG